MTVANNKSTAITNSDRAATSGLPDILNKLLISGGLVAAKVGYCAKATTDGDGSVFRCVRVSSGARISKLWLYNSNMAGLTAVDVGVYETAANGGAAVAQHLFATALDQHVAGSAAPVELRFNGLGVATAEQALWQLLGLASDPGKSYDIAATATTAGAAAGNIMLEVYEINGMQ